jgi:hypothetical protein
LGELGQSFHPQHHQTNWINSSSTLMAQFSCTSPTVIRSNSHSATRYNTERWLRSTRNNHQL